MMNGYSPQTPRRICFLAMIIGAFVLCRSSGAAQNEAERLPKAGEIKISLVKLHCLDNYCGNNKIEREDTLRSEFIDTRKLNRIEVKTKSGDRAGVALEYVTFKFQHAPDDFVRLKFESGGHAYVSFAVVDSDRFAERRTDGEFSISPYAIKHSATLRAAAKSFSYVVFVSEKPLQKTSFYENLASGRDAKRTTGSAMMSNLGAVYGAAGDYNKSIEFYEAFLLLAKSREASDEAAAHNNLGLAHYAFSRYDKAIEHYQKALAILQMLPESSAQRLIGAAATHDNLGGVYNSLARFDLAVKNYEIALKIKRELNDQQGEFIVLNNLGAAHNLPEKYEQAIKYYDQAIKLADYLDDARGKGLALKNKASALKSMGDFAAAEVLIKQSLDLSEAAGNDLARAYAYNLRGQIAFARKNYAEAIKNYNFALEIYRAEKNRAAESTAYNNLMFAYAEQNNLNLAILYGKKSINLVQELRAEIDKLEAETQTSFAESRVFTFRKLADLLISQSRLDEAQAVLDLLKKEEFSTRTVRSRTGDALIPYSKAEAETTKLIDNLSEKLAQIAYLKQQVKENTATPEMRQSLRDLQTKEIPQINAALEKSLADLVAAQPDVNRAVDNLKKDNIKTGLAKMPVGTIALYTVLGRDEQRKINVGWIILVRPDAPSKAYQINTADIEPVIFQFRHALRRAYYDPQPLAQDLYKRIFQFKTPQQQTTLESDLRAYFADKKPDELTLMWSLDGILRYVPPAALHDGDKYLVEKYRHTSFTTQSIINLTDAPRPNWKVLGLGVSEEKQIADAAGNSLIFPALPGSKNELNKLIKEASGDEGILPGTLKMDAAFGKESLTDLQNLTPTEKPAVIHISSHFAFNPANEDASFLLLGDGGKFDLAEFKISEPLFDGVDLLVLSACDTATTASSDGKEVESFGFKAQEHRAKSVIASLWQVADIGTDELMLAFYRIRQENPTLTKGEAFRRAQSALLTGEVARAVDENTLKGAILLNQPGKTVLNLQRFRHNPAKPFAHPHFWSAFILIGNWK